MSEPVYIFSAGLWRLRAEVSAITGLEPRLPLLGVGSRGSIAGWGHKPTADRARAVAKRRGLPYLAFEDGFLRSVRPGPGQRPCSMIMDRTGIYYDARHPSDLETMLETGAVPADDIAASAAIMAEIASRRLSKYNNGRDCPEDLRLPAGRPVVLVVDQTFADQSVAGGLADAASFARMYDAAVAENPGATIVAKLHPEVVAGSKSGYLRALVRADTILLSENICPWALFDCRPKVYTVSSQLGFEALMAGCQVVCFGAPFYSGWGLTDDRAAVWRRTRSVSLHELVAAVYLRYCHYFDAWRRHPVTAAEAIDQLDFLRRHFHGNRQPVAGYRIARWKRRAVTAMLDGPHGAPVFTSNRKRAISEARRRQGAIAAWGVTARAMRASPDCAGITCLAVEDGFVRSAGLGAAFVQPLSLVFDARGLHYDAGSPSDLEHMLATESFDAPLLRRARDLRLRLIAEKVTKYNLRNGAPLDDLPKDRPVVLVPGQVADDWAVKLGSTLPHNGTANVNEVLLASARQRNPHAFVIFKPHPDVEHLGRRGALSKEQELRDADRVIRTASMESLLAAVTQVETFCSLAGFEALLRGVAVTAHGMPFYAGWGLTEDIESCSRRGRKRGLDELVAATLIAYPRYWDPVSGLPCPAEVALDRLSDLRGRRPGLKSAAAALAGRAVIVWRRLVSRR